MPVSHGQPPHSPAPHRSAARQTPEAPRLPLRPSCMKAVSRRCSTWKRDRYNVANCTGGTTRSYRFGGVARGKVICVTVPSQRLTGACRRPNPSSFQDGPLEKGSALPRDRHENACKHHSERKKLHRTDSRAIRASSPLDAPGRAPASRDWQCSLSSAPPQGPPTPRFRPSGCPLPQPPAGPSRSRAPDRRPKSCPRATSVGGPRGWWFICEEDPTVTERRVSPRCLTPSLTPYPKLHPNPYPRWPSAPTRQSVPFQSRASPCSLPANMFATRAGCPPTVR